MSTGENMRLAHHVESDLSTGLQAFAADGFDLDLRAAGDHPQVECRDEAGEIDAGDHRLAALRRI